MKHFEALGICFVNERNSPRPKENQGNNIAKREEIGMKILGGTKSKPRRFASLERRESGAQNHL